MRVTNAAERVAPGGQTDFWAHVVRQGRGYGWPRVSIRVTPRWQDLKARGLEVVDAQLVLELVEDGPEPLVRAAPVRPRTDYCSPARILHSARVRRCRNRPPGSGVRHTSEGDRGPRPHTEGTAWLLC
jgi:hypothetical protein